MSYMISKIFKNKKLNLQKAIEYGFEETDGLYCYKKSFEDIQFDMTVSLSEEGRISAEVTDMELNEPYTLHLSEKADGSFVGRVRMHYEELLNDIADKCFEREVFRSDTARRIIRFVRDEYGDELEFLWEKSSDSAVWRRSDNRKWYAVLMMLSRRKLGADSDEVVEIIDLRIRPEEMEDLIDSKKYFPGYHMNKKHWYTMVLDGSVSADEICKRIKNSYLLAKKK